MFSRVYNSRGGSRRLAGGTKSKWYSEPIIRTQGEVWWGIYRFGIFLAFHDTYGHTVSQSEEGSTQFDTNDAAQTRPSKMNGVG